MRVYAHLTAFYDQVPAPPGVEPTPEDVAAGKARKTRDGSGWTMRVKKRTPTHNFTAIGEGPGIIAHIIACAMPKRGRRRMTRKEAVADLLATQSYVDCFDHPDITHFEVHDDGPDEKLFREMAAPYLSATNPATGQPLLTAADLEAMVALYLEPVDGQGHTDHLHDRFGVAKAVRP